MSAERRDREALDLVATRAFAGCAVVDIALEMLARRLNVRLYGKLRGDETTYCGALTFFGVDALGIDNAGGEFPQSVRVASLALDYSDDADEGTASVSGAAGWSMQFTFDGLAYEEQPFVLASLADDF